MSKLSTTIKAEVPAAAIGKLYARLDNEATPHSLRVKKVHERACARSLLTAKLRR